MCSVSKNTQLLSLGKQLGQITMEDIQNIYTFISLPYDDFKKIIKFKNTEWNKYFEYSHQDIVSNLEQNELFDRMMKLEEDTDEETD
jgi:hypothetical protein